MVEDERRSVVKIPRAKGSNRAWTGLENDMRRCNCGETEATSEGESRKAMLWLQGEWEETED